MHRTALAAFVLGLAECSAGVQPLAVDLDPAKTQINWTLAGNVHTVHGTFHLKAAHIELDSTTGVLSGDVVVDAQSGESGNATRDKRMNKEILESYQFQEIRLTPKKLDGGINLTGNSKVLVSGTFLIHGSMHNVVIPVEVSFAGATVRCSGKFSIPYVDWGMKDPSNFLFKVDKVVEVEIVAAGQLARK